MAIASDSFAADVADQAHALPTDQRGVARPDGAADIGAFEAVEIAPVTRFRLASPEPIGTSGWYRTAVELSFTVADDGPVAQTRCVLDPPTAPASFDDLPDADCGLSSVGSDGVHTLYAASRDTGGNAEPLVVVGFKIDATAPTLAPATSESPVLLGREGLTALPNAQDATSGVASSSSRCDPIDTAPRGSTARRARRPTTPATARAPR